MRLPRNISIIDICVAVLVLIVVLLPSRSAQAVAAFDATDTSLIARAEARTFADRQDGRAVADLARELTRARQLDWATDAATTRSAGQTGSPTRWRALLAASVAHADRMEATAALAWAQRALDACNDARDACPSWEEVRVQLYTEHLDAGVRSGIDPNVDPLGFRRAAEAGMTTVRLSGGPQGDTTPAPGSGSGSGSGSTPTGSGTR